jgi:hypothetical protein
MTASYAEVYPPGWRSGGRINWPLKAVLEILEALLANPVIPVGRRITVVNHVRKAIVLHEFRPAELTVIVVPVWLRNGPTGPVKGYTFEVAFLAL